MTEEMKFDEDKRMFVYTFKKGNKKWVFDTPFVLHESDLELIRKEAEKEFSKKESAK